MTVLGSATKLPNTRTAGVPAQRLDLRSQEAPERIVRPVMLQRWDHLSFFHWPCDPAAVQRRLPPGLEVDTFDGAAWIGLIPFRLTVRVPGVPRLPWVSTCPEINVRTYVRGPDGRRGIWFFSLEASRLGAVLTARSWYRLPYMWSRMWLDRERDTVWYQSRRRWPGPNHPRASIGVRLGPAVAPEAITPLERFLMGRWRLYSQAGEGLATTRVDHPPWPVRRATVVSLHQELMAAAGLPEPDGDPVAHFSGGVEVRFERRELLLPGE